MYYYKVKIGIHSPDSYTKEQLKSMVNENMLAHSDGAPFDIMLEGIDEAVDQSGSSNVIKVSQKEYKQLIRDQKILRALEAGGVEDWEWYSESINSIDD